MDLELNNKVALVTGSHRGTGYIIAKTLAEEGAQTIIHAFSDNEVNDAIANLERAGLDVIPVFGDICTDVGAQQIQDQLADKSLVVDILINNYGTATAGKWSKLSIDQWREIANINLYSAIRMIQHCVPQMVEKSWGRIINLSSIGDHQPNSIMPHYYASKAALANTAVSLAKELSGTGVTVNTVAPGLIHTAEMEAGYQFRAKKKGWPLDWDSILDKIVEHDFPNPSGRIANRQEVADLVVFLASPRAGFINGQNIRVDGGAVRYV